MKKCPFCGEEIQSEAIKCRYCGEWLNKKEELEFTKPSVDNNTTASPPKTQLEKPYTFRKMTLYPDKFTYKDSQYFYFQITSLYYKASLNKSYSNWVDSASAFTTLKIRITLDNTITLYDRNSAFFTTIITNQSKLKEVYRLLDEKSSNARLQRYLKSLEKNGYFTYDNSTIFFSDGRVKKGNTEVRLNVAKQKNLIKIGTNTTLFGLLQQDKPKWIDPFGRNVPLGGQKFNPYEVILSEKGFGIFDDKISFKCNWDTNIILFLINKLAGTP